MTGHFFPAKAANQPPDFKSTSIAGFLVSGATVRRRREIRGHPIRIG
jgi:hypothetical protein